jgi:hypothetical protein
MRREVTVVNDFSAVMTAKFQENTDGVILEKDTYNYDKSQHDFMKFAADSYQWLMEGILP